MRSFGTLTPFFGADRMVECGLRLYTSWKAKVAVLGSNPRNVYSIYKIEVYIYVEIPLIPNTEGETRKIASYFQQKKIN